MHRVAAEIEGQIKIPLLHIADATAQEVKKVGISKVGLLGTRFTMEQDFYRGRLTKNYDIEVLIPDEPDRELMHGVIYDELCIGQVRDESRDKFKKIIKDLASRGAEGVILGCTEISLLVRPQDSLVTLFDTTAIHAHKAAEWALRDLHDI